MKVSQCYKCFIKKVLHGFYEGVTRTLFHDSVTKVPWRCYKGVVKVFYKGFYKGFTGVWRSPLPYWGIMKVLLGVYWSDVSRAWVLSWCYKSFVKVLKNFMKVLKSFMRIFKSFVNVLQKFYEGLKKFVKVLYRCYNGPYSWCYKVVPSYRSAPDLFQERSSPAYLRGYLLRTFYQRCCHVRRTVTVVRCHPSITVTDSCPFQWESSPWIWGLSERSGWCNR